ncbi:MAG: MBL fold metallo-hydrolase [Candidatus Aenigmatarchaeota archaeon]
MEIAPGILRFGGLGASGNTYLIDGEVLVDTGLVDDFDRLVSEMKAENVDFSKIGAIVNTHGHYDHIGGNRDFKRLTGAKICAHRLDAIKIETGKDSCFKFFSEKPAISPVNCRLDGGDEVVAKNHTFGVIHTPGHTNGSICLYDPKNKVLVSGDTLFAGSFGRFDLPTGSFGDMKASLEKLRKLDIDLLLPGHGGTVDSFVKEMIASILCFMPGD